MSAELHITPEERALIGKDVAASMNGVDWYKGRLEEVSDFFVPYRVYLYERGEVRAFTNIRPTEGA